MVAQPVLCEQLQPGATTAEGDPHIGLQEGAEVTRLKYNFQPWEVVIPVSNHNSLA